SLAILTEIAIAAISVIFYGFTIEALQTTTRFSGRLSLLVFSVIFLFHYKPATRVNLLSDKFYSVFAVVHGVHLIELLSFVTLSGVKLIPYRLAGGFVAYAFIFAMPLLANAARSGKIESIKFSRIDLAFHVYVWFIFFMTYLPRVLGKLPDAGGAPWEHQLLMGWVLLLLVARVAGALKLNAARNV
ncbi:MAG: hypothetical protein ACOYXT_28855, partial [Bacteroidota bacterium]